MIQVSVIIPVFKAENYIEKCAHSLFSQSLEDIEFIFVDDCSPDKSMQVLAEVINQYPHRRECVKVISHSVNMGVSAARNTGLKLAEGQYIAYCDSDDFVDCDMYKDMYYLAIQKEADAVLCDFNMYFGENNIKYIETIPVQTNNKEGILKSYLGCGWTLISTVMVRKEIYDTYQLASNDNIGYCEDFYLNFRLLYASEKIAKVNKPLYYYNMVNEASTMHNLGPKASNDEQFVYFEIIRLLKEDNVLKLYEKELSWRILKNKQDLVLDITRHKAFMEIFPASHKYILSCPKSFCNNKIKVMMWLLTHNCRLILLLILFLRSQLLGIKQ